MSTAGVADSNERLVATGWLRRVGQGGPGETARWTLLHDQRPTPDRVRGGSVHIGEPRTPSPLQGPRSRQTLNARQRELADQLHDRANKLRDMTCADENDPGLSVTDAVALAAVQLGLEPPVTVPEPQAATLTVPSCRPGQAPSHTRCGG
ncbi:hypothetical protein OTB20_40795 [Streptomyces sp. H27-H1]|uniref:hypothetical protein n=1 Tax=Streptomyces sp. H27-H1 TaxID=2996461 RepID=UPI00226F89DA|nr:hypothetical protein [Streptomyces sp. H27-H1]MCY0932380.1 hypothetical protein [Streptomyces sp. H27-H1]